MSTKLLRVSVLNGAPNDIVLPGDGTSRGGEILCKLVGDGKSLAARILLSELALNVPFSSTANDMALICYFKEDQTHCEILRSQLASWIP